jgi:hypothetical protein
VSSGFIFPFASLQAAITTRTLSLYPERGRGMTVIGLRRRITMVKLSILKWRRGAQGCRV